MPSRRPSAKQEIEELRRRIAELEAKKPIEPIQVIGLNGPAFIVPHPERPVWCHENVGLIPCPDGCGELVEVNGLYHGFLQVHLD